VKLYNSIQENPDLIGDELNADMSSFFKEGNPALWAGRMSLWYYIGRNGFELEHRRGENETVLP